MEQLPELLLSLYLSEEENLLLRQNLRDLLLSLVEKPLQQLAKLVLTL